MDNAQLVLGDNIQTFVGRLNIVKTDTKLAFVTKRQKSKYVKEKRLILDGLKKNGVKLSKVRFFSYSEQEEYTNKLKKIFQNDDSHFSFQHILFTDNKLMVRKWIGGKKLSEVLSEGSYDFVKQYLGSIVRVHYSDLFYADGWPSNIIVTPDSKLSRFDIDLMVQDKEFEIAQAIFHIVSFSREPQIVSEIVASFIENNIAKEKYGKNKIRVYVKKFIKNRIAPFLSNKDDTLYFFGNLIKNTKKEHYMQVKQVLDSLSELI